MKELFKRIRLDILLNAVISLVMGLIFIIWPTKSMGAIAWVIGILVLVYAVIDFVVWLIYRQDSIFHKSLVMIIIEVFFGILIITNIDFVVGAFGAIFAIYMIVVSVTNLQESIYMKRFGFSNWFIPMVLSILSIGGGVYLLLNLRSSVIVNAIIIGIALLVQAISSFYVVFAMKKIEKAVK